ncbi:MAG: aldo/keto reductase [Planctomycetota bacterium]
MNTITLSNTDLVVSRLCFGCWGIVSDAHWGDRQRDDSLAAMNKAIELGVNFFDTAPVYGNGASEELLGDFLVQHPRTDVIVASKVPPSMMKPEDVIKACEDSLQRLQREVIDLYQTHWTDPNVPIEETWQAMLELQQQGKVRHIGVCNAGPTDLTRFGSVQKVVTNQLPFNLLWRAIEFEIQPRCSEEGIGILAYSPLMHGILGNRYQAADEVPDGRARTRHFHHRRDQTRHGEDGCEALTFETLRKIRELAARIGQSVTELALAWVLAQDRLDVVIAGARDAEQLRTNVQSLELELSSEVFAELSEMTNALKAELGRNVDMWDGSGNGRIR